MRFTGKVLFGVVTALLLPLLLFPLAYLGVALGGSPWLIRGAGWLAPLGGVACGALIAGGWVTRRSWLAGLLVGAGMVLIWVLTCSFLVSRWVISRWPGEAWPHLTLAHLWAWLLALGVAVAAGMLGGRVHTRRRGVLLAAGGVVLIYLVMLGTGSLIAPEPVAFTTNLAQGVTMEYTPLTEEGTETWLVTADFSRNPRLALGIYDADAVDATPGDDHCTAYLVDPLPLALPRIAADATREGRRVLCASNGDFFDFDKTWHGWHLSPLVSHGQLQYPVRKMVRFHDQDWQFGVRRAAGKAQFVLAHDFSPEQWKSEFEMAVGGVRPLRVNGKDLELHPGNGNMGLRCSRTSFAWSADSSVFYLLIAQDLDGEIASGVQKKLKFQTGGMSLPELQAFWARRSIPNAVILDGGDSTQFSYYRDARPVTTPSGYLFSYTLGYLRHRPIRTATPMFPPAQNHVGVMNYFYLAGD